MRVYLVGLGLGEKLLARAGVPPRGKKVKPGFWGPIKEGCRRSRQIGGKEGRVRITRLSGRSLRCATRGLLIPPTPLLGAGLLARNGEGEHRSPFLTTRVREGPAMWKITPPKGGNMLFGLRGRTSRGKGARAALGESKKKKR